VQLVDVWLQRSHQRRRRIATEQREFIADIAGLLLTLSTLVGISFADLAAV
jgi:hypothetical protein